MTRLLFSTPTKYLAIRPDVQGRAVGVSISQQHFSVSIALQSERLEVSVGLSGGNSVDSSGFRMFARPGNLKRDYKILFTKNSRDEKSIAISQDGQILVDFACEYSLDSEMDIDLRNAICSGAHWDDFAPRGIVSAPGGSAVTTPQSWAGNTVLVLVDAGPEIAGEIRGVIAEQLSRESEVILLSAGDATLEDEIMARVADKDVEKKFDEVVLISVGESGDPDAEIIFDVIDDCPENGLRVFLGGFVQKMHANALSGLSAPGHYMLVPRPIAKLPNLSFDPAIWAEGVPPRLSAAFASVAQQGSNVSNASSSAAGRPRSFCNSVNWKPERFWTHETITLSEGDALGFGWLMSTIFGHGRDKLSEVYESIRKTARDCRRQNIGFFGLTCGTGEKQTQILVDARILDLAADSTFARGRRPVQEYFDALERRVSVMKAASDAPTPLVLFYLEDTASHETVASFANFAAANIASVANGTASAGEQAGREAYLQDCRDLVELVAAINAVAEGKKCSLNRDLIVRQFGRHGHAMTEFSVYCLRLGAPGIISVIADSLNALNFDLLPNDQLAIQEAMIGSRTFPRINKQFLTGMDHLTYASRLWAALQLLEQTTSQEYEAGGQQLLQHLTLKEADLNFHRVLSFVKQGDLKAALALGCEKVVTKNLKPKNERDILAIALFAEDFGAADTIFAELSEPLSDLDTVYYKGTRAAREGQFSSEDRKACTEALLNLDPDFGDLKVGGRQYETLFESPLPPPVPGEDVICVITAKNEEARLQETLEHQYALGIRHFILIDNMSSDGTVELARKYDARIIQTCESYKDSRYGMAWVNDILDRYCTGHWVLVVDADEMFIYPDMETRPVKDLVRQLETDGFEGLSTILLDMYPDAPISSFRDIPTGQLREIYRYFDFGNFAFWPRLRSPLLGVSGGVRERLFRIGKFANLEPIAQTKTPLLKWQHGMKFLTSTHDVTPIRTPPFFGVLEHYKYTPDFVLRARREVVRKEHWGGGSEYSAYASVLETDPGMSFVSPSHSRERETAAQVIDMVSPFRWPSTFFAGE